jgi:hypothetical protein
VKKQNKTDPDPVHVPVNDVSKEKGKNAPVAEIKDLSKGSVKRAIGNARDSKNRAVNGTVTVKKANVVQGQSKTVDGAFEVRNIQPGAYTFEMKSNQGGVDSKSVAIDSQAIVVVNFSF